MPLLYMLQQPIAVDSPDTQGHTSLMWAAYQGDAISVDILIKHGASIAAKDSAGLTPLHWAVVRGNRFCIKRLIEAGADFHAKDDSGKTPHDLALEIKSVEAYKSAMEEAGYTEVGSRKVPLMTEVSMLLSSEWRRVHPSSQRQTKYAIFMIPLIIFYAIFKTLSLLPYFTAIPAAAAEFFAMHHVRPSPTLRVIRSLFTSTAFFRSLLE
jgi:palmitoyltransferase